MSTWTEWEHVGFGRYDWVTHYACDRCRAEILLPWLAHYSTMGYQIICVRCYDTLMYEAGR